MGKASQQAAPRKRGRKSKFTPALGLKICEQIVEGKSLRVICKKVGVSLSMLFRYMEESPAFREQYARAKKIQADVRFDEIVEIADRPRVGKRVKNGPKGLEITTGDMVERAKLQVDARKWVAAKLLPKKYGDVKGEGDGDDGKLDAFIEAIRNSPTGEV